MPTAQLKFCDNVTECPENAPLGFPHILDLSEPFQSDVDAVNPRIRLTDGVATFLYNYDSAAMHAFLDLHRAKFEYVLEQSGGLSLYIARFGQSIQVGLHSDGWSEGVTTFKYLLSTTGQWKPTFAYKGIISYSPDEIEVLGNDFATDLISGKGWERPNVEHKVLWTKLPIESGYRPSYDGRQQEFYGLPGGWEEMTDCELDQTRKREWDKKPFEDRDSWPFELLNKTEC